MAKRKNNESLWEYLWEVMSLLRDGYGMALKGQIICYDIDMRWLCIGYGMAIIGYIAIIMHCICVSIKYYAVYHY